MAKLCSTYFSSNGSWTCPSGVTKVFLIGHGGGAGGDGGMALTGSSNYPGNGTTPYLVSVSVTPNSTYTITIGSGGTGGAPRVSPTRNGGTGGSTTFGSLYTFPGATVGENNLGTLGPTTPIMGLVANRLITGGTDFLELTSGFVNYTQTGGASSGSYPGGRGGTPGASGSAPGQGGAGNNAGAGFNATPGSGFGFGGAAGGNGSTSGGSGGDGGPGQLWVIWVE